MGEELKRALALLGSLSIILGLFSPLGAWAADSVSTKLLAPFPSQAVSLTLAQKTEIRAFLSSQPSAYKIRCTAQVAKRPSTVQMTIAKKRSTAACAFAKAIKLDLQLVIGSTVQTATKSLQNRVVLSLFTAQASVPGDELTSPTPKPSSAGYEYLPCDTPTVDTNAPSISQSDVREVDCAEDAQTPSEALPSEPFPSDGSICLLKDVSPNQSLRVGFPYKTTNLDSKTAYKVVVIPVDFADFPGKGRPSDFNKKPVEKFVDYYKQVSSGKFKLQMDFQDEWFRLPGKMADYQVSAADYQNPYSSRTKEQKTRLFHGGVSIADPKVDFTDTAIVLFVLPQGQTAIELTLQGFWGGDLPSPAPSNEGLVKNFFTSGNYFTLDRVWSYYAHELGHTIMLPDYYIHAANYGKEHLIQIPSGPMSGFEMMSTQDGPSRTLSFWSRFMMGWTEPTQLHCNEITDYKDSSFVLEPIDNLTSNLKSVVIKTGEHTAVVVESRRVTNFDEITTRSRNGVLVYTVDTSVNHGEGSLKLVAPKGRGLIFPFTTGNRIPQLDAILYVGNSVDVAGLHITVNKTGATDTVSISKQK